MAALKREWLESFYTMLSEFGELPLLDAIRGVETLRHRHLVKDEYFIREGERPDTMAFIAKGLFRVFYITEGAEERTLVFRGQGRMISAFSAYLENRDSWYSIQSLEDSDLICVSFDDYKRDLAQNEYLREINARYVEMILLEKENRERELLCDDAQTRYEKFISRYPGIEARLKQYHIASYLGITPVALSRIRKRQKNSEINQG